MKRGGYGQYRQLPDLLVGPQYLAAASIRLVQGAAKPQLTADCARRRAV
jgi:hypothetical protein